MSNAVHIVVPLLNEAGNVERLCGAFRELAAEEADGGRAVRFVLVDDGSTDGTADRVGEHGRGLDLIVLTHPTNRGPGAAFATAFARLAGELADGDWVVTMEGDNTSRHELLQRMFRRAGEGFDLVLASPHVCGGRIAQASPGRVLLSAMANLFARSALGIHGLFSVTCFFRLQRGRLVRRLQEVYGPRIIERRGFEGMTEMLMKAIYLGAAISEVPLVLDSGMRAGPSKMRVGRTIAGYLGLSLDRRRWIREAEAQPEQPAP